MIWKKSHVFQSFCEFHIIGYIIIIHIIVLKFLLNDSLISGHLDCHFCASLNKTIWFSLAKSLASLSGFFFFFFFWRQLTTTSITVSNVRIFISHLTLILFLESYDFFFGLHCTRVSVTVPSAVQSSVHFKNRVC